MRIKVWLSILLCISMLAGCSFSFGSPLDSLGMAKESDQDTLGLTPDFSYTTPKQTPNILVNQIGYLPEESKVAILQGNGLDTFFGVYDAATNQPIFAGTLKEARISVYQKENRKGEERETLYLADFSSLKKEGSYYLYQKNLGYSDIFVIQEGAYASLEVSLLDRLALDNRDTSSLCYQLAGILLTLELYPEKILEPERLQRVLKEKIELLSLAQDEKTGSVYEVIPQETEAQAISLAATAEFAGVMAMYANYLQATDIAAATQAQLSAERAFSSIRGSLDNVSYDAGYFAVTQLFKKTGRARYSQAIGQYLGMKEEAKSYTRYDFSLFGDYAYLSCKYSTNMEWNKQLMNKVMKQAETISLTSGKDNYYVSGVRDFYDVEGMLKDMSVMALVNYIITNHEYSTLQKNYRDYFLGRNPDAVCLAEGFGKRNLQNGEGVSQADAALLYLLLQSTK